MVLCSPNRKLILPWKYITSSCIFNNMGKQRCRLFFWYTLKLMQAFRYSSSLGKFCLGVVCIIMIISVCLPYDPIQYPQLSKWHTRLAMWSTIGYVLLFFHFLFDTFKKDYRFLGKLFLNILPLLYLIVCFFY